MINGKTAVYAVIGNPIAHTFSPQIHNYLANHLGHNLVYVPLLAERDRLGDCIAGARGLNIAGLNVTIPYKTEVMQHLHKIDETAQAVGAVNTLKLTEHGYIGYNTDHAGITESFRRRGIELAGRGVTVIGAGGSSYAACVAAAKGLAKKIFIINRTEKNAYVVANHIKKYYNISIEVFSYENYIASRPDADVAIQTTPVGFSNMKGTSPVTPEFFDGIRCAIDIIYSPWETQFLRDADASGAVAFNGFDMLFYQAVAAYEIWLGERLDTSFTDSAREELSRLIPRGTD